MPAPFLIRILCCLCLVGLLCPGASAQSAAPQQLPTPPLPLASVVEFGQLKQIPLTLISPAQDRLAAPGDLAVLLITLFEGSVQKQWLLEVSVVEPRAEEKPAKTPPKTVLYVSTGSRLEYDYTPLSLSLKTHGPFVAATKPDAVHTVSARSVVNEDDLRLGFDAVTQMMLRMRADIQKEKNPRKFGLGFQSKPFPDDVVKKTKVEAASFGVTPADERAFAGSGPALISFFKIAENNAGLRDILWEIVDLPSAWSVMKRGGRVDPYFDINGNMMRRIETLPGQLDRYVFAVALHLNGQPALKLQLVVTSPKPPLLTMAGILEIHAEHPTKPNKHAIIQVLATRTGENKS